MREPAILLADTPAGLSRGTDFVADDVQLYVPGWVVDLDSFRRWTATDDFPERGNIWWLRGRVWADTSKEQLFTHLLAKQAFFKVLGQLADGDCPGLLIPDGLLLSNIDADISGNPDATYIAAGTLESDRIRLLEGTTGGCVEIQGTPDMVLEVVSAGSVRKDLSVLPEAYWMAGIPEYWVVDARQQPIRFDILRRGPKGYKRTPNKHGWTKSSVFNRSFRLTASTGLGGRLRLTLEVR
jgi:hypothetical protein